MCTSSRAAASILWLRITGRRGTPSPRNWQVRLPCHPIGTLGCRDYGQGRCRIVIAHESGVEDPKGAQPRDTTLEPPIAVLPRSHARLGNETCTSSAYHGEGSMNRSRGPDVTTPHESATWAGLQPPRFDTGNTVTGEREAQEGEQATVGCHPSGAGQDRLLGKPQMCPQDLTLHHPAAPTLLECAAKGCPTDTGCQWTRDELEAAITKGPHSSALNKDAMVQLATKVDEKVCKGQVQVVNKEDIHDNPLANLKILPVAMMPHKSRKFRAILDLSFLIRLNCGRVLDSVNDSLVKEVPRGAVVHMGHVLTCIIYLFTTPPLVPQGNVGYKGCLLAPGLQDQQRMEFRLRPT